MKVNDLVQVLNGLKPLAHAYSADLESQKIIAKADNNEIRLVDLFPENSNIEKTLKLKNNEKIVNVISQTFQNEDDSFLLTTQKTDESTFQNYLCKFNSNEQIFLFKSTSTPMLIVDPHNLNSLILFSDKNLIKIGNIEDNEFKEQLSTKNLSRIPNGIHTSSFTDITGNMHADIALHVKDKGINYIDVYRVEENLDFELVESVKLGVEIGPVLFSEISGYLGTDIIFVSKENNKYYLNLYINQSLADLNSNFPKNLNSFKDLIEKRNASTSKTSEIFQKKSIKFNLSDIFNDLEPVLINEDGMPSGIFLADLTGSGSKDIFLTLKSSVTGKYQIRALQYTEETFVLNPLYTINTNAQYDYIHSLSICDYNNSGEMNLLVTYANTSSSGKSYKSVPIELDGQNRETGISLLTLYKTDATKSSYVPGTSIAMLYENEEKFIKFTLASQTSFASLQPIKLFIGLGPTNLFINWATIKIPCFDNKINRKDAVSFLVPNTFAVFTLHKDVWRVQSFFSKMFFKFTGITLIAILIIFMVIFIVLSIQEKKKYKLVMSKDSTRTVFNAL